MSAQKTAKVVSVIATIFVLIVVFLMLVISLALLSGFTIMTLWGWFVVPVFDMPALSLVQSLGLYLVLYAFITPLCLTQGSKSTTQDAIISLLVLYGWNAVALLLGRLLLMFM